MKELKKTSIIRQFETKSVGNNLRTNKINSKLYFELKNERRRAREQDKKSISNGRELWIKVAKDAQYILDTVSKDLEIMCWLWEAWTNIDGLTGMKRGLVLTRELLQEFWPQLHPIDNETCCLQPIENLNGASRPGPLIDALNNIIVFKSSEINYNKNDLLHILKQNSDSGKRELISKLERLNCNHIKHLESTVNQCIEEHKELCQWIDQLEQNVCVGSSNIKNNLEEWSTLISWLKNSINVTPSEETCKMDTSKDNEPIDGKSIELQSKKSTHSRTNALEYIRMAADYFITHERHSPVAYLLDKAIRWGDMSLPELLNEIINDEKIRREIFTLTGINNQPRR